MVQFATRKRHVIVWLLVWAACGTCRVAHTDEVKDRQCRDVLGWQLYIHPQLLKSARQDTERAIELLTKQLDEINRKLPSQTVAKLKEVLLYFSPEYPNTHEVAYAMTNPMEYFAETSEAYWSTNDFYPFDRKQLKAYDPVMFELLGKIWGINSGDSTSKTCTPFATRD